MIDRYSYNTPYRQPMRLGGVWFDATMERSRSYSSDVPTYPVEKGFKISDAVLKNPLEITLKAVITEMPLTFRQEGYGAYANTRHVSRVLEELQEMYYIAEPVSLYTNSGTYDNLVIQSMTFPETTEMVNAVEVSITLKQVRITGNYELDGYVYEGESGIDAGTIIHGGGGRGFGHGGGGRSFNGVESVSGGVGGPIYKSYFAGTGGFDQLSSLFNYR